MALESATYISDLVSTNPTSSDNLSQGDDHLRLLKSTIKATFPNVSGAVLPTHTELNFVDGVTSSIQTQLDARAVLASANTFTGDQTINGNLIVSGAVSGFFPAGTKMLFQQTAAPTGWTKDTTHNDKALRVVSGAASSGGTVAFSTAFANRTVSGNVDNFTATGTVGDTALTIAQMPAHTHNTGFLQNANTATTGSANRLGGAGTTVSIATDSVGGGATHTHTFTGAAHAHSFSTTLDMAVQYVDLIIATKN